MKSIRSILCYFNVDQEDPVAVESAIWMARAHDARLTVIDIQPEPSWRTRAAAGFDQEVVPKLVENRLTELSGQVAELCADSTNVEVKVLRGNPWVEIIREVLRRKHDLVVKAGDGDQGLLSSLFGYTAAHLLRKCPCPVWLVGRGADPRSRRVLVAINPDLESDASIEFNRKLVEIASLVAEQHGAELLLIHVWDEWGYGVPCRGMANSVLGRAMTGVGAGKRNNILDFLSEIDQHGLADKVSLAQGAPGHAIAEFAAGHGVDLVVVGSSGPTRLRGLLVCDVAETLLRQTAFSVLSVNPLGFVS